MLVAIDAHYPPAAWLRVCAGGSVWLWTGVGCFEVLVWYSLRRTRHASTMVPTDPITRLLTELETTFQQAWRSDLAREDARRNAPIPTIRPRWQAGEEAREGSATRRRPFPVHHNDSPGGEDHRTDARRSHRV